MPIVSIPFTDYARSVRQALDALEAGPVFARGEPVLLKPNLVNAAPFPVTTPPELCAALIDAIREHTDAEIVIAEGSGDPGRETDEVFATLGYARLAREKDVQLLDLNKAPLRTLEDPRRLVHKRMHLPEILFDHFLVSLPVLKAHSLASITGSLKNMFGVAPPEHYGGRHGSWKKAVFHGQLQEGILDLCAYRAPDLSIMDATQGLRDFHLGGPTLDPPPQRILAGWDPWEVDREAASLLGLDWQDIRHLHKPA